MRAVHCNNWKIEVMNCKTIALLLFLLVNLNIYGQEGEVREIEVIGYSQREILDLSERRTFENEKCEN